MTDDNMYAGERRRHHALREVFMQACVLLAPSVIGNVKSPRTSSFAMMHMVQGHFPELSSSEAHVIIVTVEHLHRENRLQTLLEEQADAKKA